MNLTARAQRTVEIQSTCDNKPVMKYHTARQCAIFFGAKGELGGNVVVARTLTGPLTHFGLRR